MKDLRTSYITKNFVNKKFYLFRIRKSYIINILLPICFGKAKGYFGI